jgi:hypothetical protein
MLAPFELLVRGPFPGVRMDGELEVGMKVVPLGVPALAFTVAHDLGGRGGRTQGQGARGYKKRSAQSVHIETPYLRVDDAERSAGRMVAGSDP